MRHRACTQQQELPSSKPGEKRGNTAAVPMLGVVSAQGLVTQRYGKNKRSQIQPKPTLQSYTHTATTLQ